ncbi:MAG: zinc-ribbon domain-containing protein [Oscillospiraceae bacterium]|nr:zinc-ribbon domain-containing protein [Oscillospiraceae bacterium]
MMIICKKCGAECPDGNIFCEKCGKELEVNILPDNIDPQGNVINREETKETPRGRKTPKVPVKMTEAQKAARRRTLRILGIILAVIAVCILAVTVYNTTGSQKGFNASQKVPLGRNVEYAESETGLKFTEKSANGMINTMTDFDYICVSEKTVKVSGSEQPQWAIMLSVDSDGMINEVEYYDFSQLRVNWQGRKMAEMLDENYLTYGMSIKNVNKSLGMKPYYVKRNVSNDSLYCYRYYFTDEKAGYDRAFNFYVGFSDTDLSVRSVEYSEIEYAKVILNADNDIQRPVAGVFALPAADEADSAAENVTEEVSDEETEESSEEETAE